MKVANKYIKQCKNLIIFSLLIVLFSEKIVAMRMSSSSIRYTKALIAKKRAREEAGDIVREPGVVGEGKYFLHPQDSEYGVIISKDALQKSDFLNSQVMDVPTMDRKIAIVNYSIDQIKLVCDVLKNFIAERLEPFINKFTFNNLIDLVNLLDKFSIEQDIIKVVLSKIEKDIVGEKESLDSKFDSLKGLNINLQRLLMTNQCIDYLIMLIMDINWNKRVSLRYDQYLLSNRTCMAWSYDGNTIIRGGHNVLELWKIGALSEFRDNVRILNRRFLSDQYLINTLSINPDGTKIIAGYQQNLSLFDIKDLDNIVIHSFVGVTPNIKDIQAVAVSPDGTKVVAGGFRAQGARPILVLWDINNINNPIYLKNAPLLGVYSIAFSPDSKKLVAGGAGHKTDNLKLWDVSDISDKNKLENQEPQALVGNEGGIVYAIAFNPAGDKIISGGENHLMLWDMAKSTITSQSLLSEDFDQRQGTIKFVAFSFDGNMIFVSNRWYNYELRGNSNFFWVYDVNDLQNIYKSIKRNKLHFELMSHNRDKIIIVNEEKSENHLFLYTPFTKDENKIVERIKTYKNEQLQLLYELCIRLSKKDWQMSKRRKQLKDEVIKTLPLDMQELLNELGVF